jgi:transposase
MIKMNEIKKIKKAFLEEGLNKNQLVKRFRRSWKTISKIVDTTLEDLEEAQNIADNRRRRAVVGTEAVINAIKVLLEGEQKEKIKKKQRFTAKAIYRRLTEEKIYTGSYRRMQELVKKIRCEIMVDAKTSYLPLSFPLGSALQVDHGEVECVIDGTLMLCYLFVASVPGTTLRYCQLFGCKSREAWGEFHERAFRKFGGIFSNVIYDNDTVLITDAEEKIQTEFSLYLVEHYKFIPRYCNPAAGNEKGSVENAVGFCRRNYLAGRPEFDTFTQANLYLEKQFLESLATDKHHRTGQTAADMLRCIQEAVDPLFPPKVWYRRDSRLVNSYQLVEIEKHFYSVPEKYVGTRVRVSIGAFSIKIQAGEETIMHERKFTPGEDSLIMDHYLEQLQRKSGAVWDCKATHSLLEDPLLKELQKALIECKEYSELRTAQRDFIKILYLRRDCEEAKWRDAITKALACGLPRSEAVEGILKLQASPKNEIDEKAIRERFPHIANEEAMDFCLKPYANLYGEES